MSLEGDPYLQAVQAVTCAECSLRSLPGSFWRRVPAAWDDQNRTPTELQQDVDGFLNVLGDPRIGAADVAAGMNLFDLHVAPLADTEQGRFEMHNGAPVFTYERSIALRLEAVEDSWTSIPLEQAGQAAQRAAACIGRVIGGQCGHAARHQEAGEKQLHIAAIASFGLQEGAELLEHFAEAGSPQQVQLVTGRLLPHLSEFVGPEDVSAVPELKATITPETETAQLRRFLFAIANVLRRRYEAAQSE